MLASVQDIGFGIMDSRVGAEVMAITSFQDIDFGIMDSRVGCWPPFRI